MIQKHVVKKYRMQAGISKNWELTITLDIAETVTTDPGKGRT